jgi:2-oxoglutarate dehydrogenase E1 component
LLSAGEKWGLMNGLVLYLPHGYEGQGAEHSSGRMERFLNYSIGDNMQVVNITTPANIFHILRRQVLWNIRIPLVVFTPKSLLRHPECISSLDELATGCFREVIDDEYVDVQRVSRLVFCSGKIYFDLLQRKNELNAVEVALVRIEQLYPFPLEQVQQILKKYQQNKVILWVQEEPENMGAWKFIREKLSFTDILLVARCPSASPATGLQKIHQAQQQEIINKVFRICDCNKKNRYCDLQCITGSSRMEILKQYEYFMSEDLQIKKRKGKS